MSEQAPPRPERLLALFVTILWAAVAFAVDGFLALLLDRDPIETDVAPFYALVAFAISGVVVWMLVSGTSVSRHPWWGALAAAAGVYLVLIGVAAIWSLPLAGEQAVSPFVLSAAVLAGLAVAGTWAVVHRGRRSGPPDIERIP